VICLSNTISLEVLNLLYILSHKYSFFKLRKSEQQSTTVDIEQNYLLNSSINASKLSLSDTCLLIGINPRYEGSQLNLNLRSRYLKGNFKIVQISSLSNITCNTRNLSNNIKSLKSLIEGNSLFCQELVNASNPILISNSEIFKRKDSFSLANSMKLLMKYINTFSYSQIREQLNILSSTLNENGINNLNVFKSVQSTDVKSSQGIYFLNDSFNSYNIKKLLNLKLLNFFQNFEDSNRLLITQSNTLKTKRLALFKNNFQITNQVHLPNNVLFETSGAYLNAHGKIDKTTKVIRSLNQTKSD
jgi:NADH dehydrogenase/NADH:ubiquinone oxidoreductase subunit G